MAESERPRSSGRRMTRFRLCALILATLLVNLGIVASLRWIMGFLDGAALLTASAGTLLIGFVDVEFVRGRFQLSPRVLLASITWVALFRGLLGNRLVESRKRHGAVTTIVHAGGRRAAMV